MLSTLMGDHHHHHSRRDFFHSSFGGILTGATIFEQCTPAVAPCAWETPADIT
jgi:hypothetical protein